VPQAYAAAGKKEQQRQRGTAGSIRGNNSAGVNGTAGVGNDGSVVHAAGVRSLRVKCVSGKRSGSGAVRTLIDIAFITLITAAYAAAAFIIDAASIIFDFVLSYFFHCFFISPYSIAAHASCQRQLPAIIRHADMPLFSLFRHIMPLFHTIFTLTIRP